MGTAGFYPTDPSSTVLVVAGQGLGSASSKEGLVVVLERFNKRSSLYFDQAPRPSGFRIELLDLPTGWGYSIWRKVGVDGSDGEEWKLVAGRHCFEWSAEDAAAIGMVELQRREHLEEESKQVQTWALLVPSVPVAQPRHQFRTVLPAVDEILRYVKDMLTFEVDRRGVSNFRKWLSGKLFVRPYISGDHPIHEWKQRVAREWRSLFGDHPKEAGAFDVDLVFVFPRPKAKIWKTKPMPRYLHALTTPDLDNLEKAILDALTGIVWKSDGQVAQLRSEKWVADGDEFPHARIVVRYLGGEEESAPDLFDNESKPF